MTTPTLTLDDNSFTKRAVEKQTEPIDNCTGGVLEKGTCHLLQIAQQAIENGYIPIPCTGLFSRSID